MLLQKLAEYSARIKRPPANYIEKPIVWIIDIDSNGNLLGITPTGDPKDRTSLKTFLCPHIMRAAAVKPKLLSDNGEYVLGVGREGGNPEKVKTRHEAFVKIVRGCAEATGNPDVKAVLQFLDKLDPDSLSLDETFHPSHELTFRVDDRLPIDHNDVREYWASTFMDEKAKKMQCIVCGRMRIPEKRFQQKIKRIPQGQQAGNALISANVPAFESHGLKASLIAPTCADCVEKFSLALNDLLRRQDTHISVGPVAYVFWTKEDVDFSAAELLSDPDPQKVKALIQAAFKGSDHTAEEDLTPFYAAALTASGSRIAVRDWIDTTVGSAKQSMALYFQLQAITNWDGAEGSPLKLSSLSGATVRDFKDLPARVPRSLIKLALAGGPLPDDILFQAINRNRAEQRVTRPRAALIKLALLSHKAFGFKENQMVELESSNKEPAYLCGRLLAVLESIQRLAQGGIKATIIDRYFGTASSAPATVFGTLMRGAQAHLSKLRKEKTGLYITMEKELEEITAGLTHFPAKLSLKDQALFSLGYYHQRAHRKPTQETKANENEN